jgi:glyoxylase-like metal-dependent hydrolase (beta-lactamase superfamily II)
LIVTGVAQRQAWQEHQFPPVEQVATGLWSVPVTIPDSPLRYTLAYLIHSDGCVIAVDPGWDSETGWQDLLRGLAVAGIAADRVTGIVVTHVHPDHHGLSRRLKETSGAWVAMHAAEVETLPARIWRAGGGAAGDRGWLARCGVPVGTIGELTFSDDQEGPFWRMPDPDVLLNDGDDIDLPGRRLRVVWTPGHTPGHICLHDADHDLLLTGDHLLPRITPNIGLAPGGQGSPLAGYLASLRRVRGYDSAEALPAHEYRFRGIAGRADAIAEHHKARAEEIISVIASSDGPTIWQIAQRLTWSRGWAQITGFMRRAALAETAAHIAYLEEKGGLLTRAAGSPGGDQFRIAMPETISQNG